MYKESVVLRKGSENISFGLNATTFYIVTCFRKIHNLFRKGLKFLFTIQEEQGRQKRSFLNKD